MLSKNQIKLITSLTQKKYRKQHQLFIAEGGYHRMMLLAVTIPDQYRQEVGDVRIGRIKVHHR